MDIETIVSELKGLTPAKQKEVHDFISFLRYQDKTDWALQKGATKKLEDEAFIGM